MAKFFQKIKNNLDMSITKEKSSEKNIINEEDSSSISSDNEDENKNSHSLLKDNSKDLISKNIGNNKFAENFVKQRTLFETKMIKFDNKRNKGNNFLDDNIEEQEDEDDNEYHKRNSQDLGNERMRNSILSSLIEE